MNMIAISATITFSARFLSHEVAVGALLGFVGSIPAIDSADRHLCKRPVAGQPLRTMAGDAGRYTGLLASWLQRVDPLERALGPVLAVLVEVLLLGKCAERIEVRRVDLLALRLEEVQRLFFLRAELDHVV